MYVVLNHTHTKKILLFLSQNCYSEQNFLHELSILSPVSLLLPFLKPTPVKPSPPPSTEAGCVTDFSLMALNNIYVLMTPKCMSTSQTSLSNSRHVFIHSYVHDISSWVSNRSVQIQYVQNWTVVLRPLKACSSHSLYHFIWWQLKNSS